MILYGRVSQWNGTAEGDSLRPVNVISQLYAGDAFGMEWTREDQPRPYSIVTEEATVLISVKRTHFYAVEQSVFRDILNERIDLLCRIPQFRETRLRKVRDAAAAMTVLEYRAGQVLMVQGAGCVFSSSSNSARPPHPLLLIALHLPAQASLEPPRFADSAAPLFSPERRTRGSC